MELILDSREPPRIIQLSSRLARDLDLGFRRVKLPMGDLGLVLNSQIVVIERKTPSDLVSSIRDHRLWEQLLNFLRMERVMGYEVKRRIMLIDGKLTDLISQFWYRDLENLWASIYGALMEICLVYQTPVFICENDSMLYQSLRILIKREISGENDSAPEIRWKFEKLPVKDPQLLMAASIPEIGFKTAQNLLAHFGSILSLAQATPRELARVRGVGSKRAKLIYEFFRKKYSGQPSSTSTESGVSAQDSIS